MCSTPRCSLCRLEKFHVGWKDQGQALYTLCKHAALPGLTIGDPGFVQPPDLADATTNIICTTLAPDPTYDQFGLREGLLSLAIPEHSTSLIEHNLQAQVLPSTNSRIGFDLSSLSVEQLDSFDIAPDPSHLATSIPKPSTDLSTSRQYQADTIGLIIDAFERWKAEGSNDFNDFNGASLPRNAVPPSTSQPNQTTAPGQSRKRTSNQHSSSKQRGSKRAKVSNDESPQARIEDKRLLACPFWKKDPVRHRNCFRGVKRIRDVKQHLRRSHIQPVFCRRCGTEFGDEEAALSEHLRAAELCEIRYFQDPDGITTLHQKALKRHSDRSADEAAQWYVIWDYLFPSGHDVEPPPPSRPNSPYVDYDLSEEMSSFREFSRREGWRALVDAGDPDVSDVAFRVDGDLLQRCLDRIYESWLAKRGTSSQQPWEESSSTLSNISTPGESAPTSDTTSIDQQTLDDNIMMLGDFSADLGLENNFLEYQINGPFDDFVAMPSVDNTTAQTFPRNPSLGSEHETEHALHMEMLDPTLISR